MRSFRPALFLVVLAIILLAADTSSARPYSQGGGYSSSHYSAGGRYIAPYPRGYYGGNYGGGRYIAPYPRSYYGGHHHDDFDLYIGWPFWGASWYYPAPYYYPSYYPYNYPYPSYYPPAISAPSSSPVYIEREEPKDSYVPQDVWFYCPDSKAYYPYVKECPGGWQMVPAQPPSEQRR